MNPSTPIDVVTHLAQVVTDQPTPAVFVQRVVQELSETHHARSGLLVRLASDGYVDVIGSFGQDAHLMQAFERLPIWDDAPITTAIRERTPQQVHRDAMSTLIALPVQARGITIGGLCLTLASGTAVDLNQPIWRVINGLAAQHICPTYDHHRVI
jgi:hypothetical protein